MKKTYETPSIEVVKFQYRDQVVVASGCIVSGNWSHETDNSSCNSDNSSSSRTKE